MSILKSAVSVVLLGFSATSFAATNVALNAPVTLNGTFGGSDPVWGVGSIAAANTLTDGTSLAAATQWNLGTIYWFGSPNIGATPFFPLNNIQVDLGGQFSIDSLVLQADDNDAYPVFYRNGAADPWQSIWNAPAVGGFGMQTRTTSIAPIIATSFLIGNAVGDGYFSVSEFQAFGAAVPEPETYVMLLTGLSLVGFMSRRRKVS
ncbi:MAG: PEP-CTERM sorting domain-containing protein [Methylotenera sp.]